MLRPFWASPCVVPRGRLLRQQPGLLRVTNAVVVTCVGLFFPLKSRAAALLCCGLCGRKGTSWVHPRGFRGRYIPGILILWGYTRGHLGCVPGVSEADRYMDIVGCSRGHLGCIPGVF